jgi:hypothetical protein
MLLLTQQLQMHKWPAGALLGVLRLYNQAGLSPLDTWVLAWSAAVQQQLPQLPSETACCLVVEILQLKQQQQQLVLGLLDDLFVAVLRDLSSCRSNSMAAALARLAAGELADRASSSSSGSGASGSRSATALPGSSAVPAPKDSMSSDRDAAAAIAAAIVADPARPPPTLADAAASTEAEGRQAPNQGLASDGSSNGQSEAQQQQPAASVDPAGASSSNNNSSSSSNSSKSLQDLSSSSSSSSSRQSPQGAGAMSSSREDPTKPQEATGAAPEVGTLNGSGSRIIAAGGSSSTGGGININLASWVSGCGTNTSNSSVLLSSTSQLYPIMLHSWLLELGCQQRLQQLQPPEVAALAAAVVALQLRVPDGWMDRWA